MQNHSRPLADMVRAFFKKQLFKSDQWFELWEHWPQWSKTEILQNTRPVSFKNGRLTLWVENSVALQELSFQTEELKNQINTEWGKEQIKTIHFTVNKDILEKRKQSAKILQKI